MVLPPYAVDTDVDLTLPTPSAGKAIVWNKDGTNLENSAVEVNALESTLKGYKESAESSATIATEKANIASDKADIATTQAGIATQKAEEATSTLSTKANKDMDNLTNTGKENILALGIPDYSAGITIVAGSSSNPNRFNQDGIVYVTDAISTSDKFLYIEKEPFSGNYAKIYLSEGGVSARFFYSFIVPKNCGFYFSQLSSQYHDYGFFPFKGGI